MGGWLEEHVKKKHDGEEEKERGWGDYEGAVAGILFTHTVVNADLQKWKYHLRSLLGCEICQEQIVEAQFQPIEHDSSTRYDFNTVMTELYLNLFSIQTQIYL